VNDEISRAAERQRPTGTDLLGTALALVDALVIIGFAPNQK